MHLGGGPCVTGTTNGLCVALIMPRAAATPDVTCTNTLSAFSTKAPVCLGPLRRGVEGACRTGAGGPFGDCGGSRIAAGSAPDACR